MHNYEAQNIELLTDYFRRGCKPSLTGKLGLELEHYVINTATGETRTYYEADGVRQLLGTLLPYFKQHYEENGALLGLGCSEYTLSLEPAGQLEISIAPQSSLAEIERIYRSFLELITPVLKIQNCALVTCGYQPKSRIANLPLIPKERYRHMDRYFRELGTCGAFMMRGTASAQLSIDYEDEQDFLLKYRCACLLTPAIQLFCDNTRVFEGALCTSHLMRELIWHSTDSDRCGIIPGTFSPDFSFEAYARFLYQLPMIFLPEEDGCRYTGTLRAAELYSSRLLTQEDISHITSMAFPDVRLKNYIEIRGADSMEFPRCIAYTALIKGLFYTPETLHALMQKYPVTETDIRIAKDSLIANGINGTIYDVPACTFLSELITLAKQGLSPEERKYLQHFSKEGVLA